VVLILVIRVICGQKALALCFNLQIKDVPHLGFPIFVFGEVQFSGTQPIKL